MNSPTANLRIRLLDTFTIERDGEPVLQLVDRKQERLLAYLAIAPRRPHLREDIAQTFWPDKARKLRRNRLAEVLVLLRKLLEEHDIPRELVVATRHTMQLSPQVETDIAAFEALAASAYDATTPDAKAEMRETLRERYGAGLLPFLHQSWVETERARLETIYIEAMRHLEATSELVSVLGARAARHGQALTFADPPPQGGSAPAHTAPAPAPPRPIDPLEDETQRLLRLAEEAAANIDGPDRPVWLKRFDEGHEAFTFALDRAMDMGDRETAARFAGSLWRYWMERQMIAEGRQRLEQILMELPESETALYTEVLHGAGALAVVDEDHMLARLRLQRAHDLWQKLGNRTGVGRALHSLGSSAQREGDNDTASQYFNEAISIQRAINHPERLIQVLLGAANVESRRGQVRRSQSLAKEALALAREHGNAPKEAEALTRLSFAATALEEFDKGADYAREALALLEDLDDQRETGSARIALGDTYFHASDWSAALDCFEQARDDFANAHDMQGVARAIWAIGGIEDERGDLSRALELGKQALQLSKACGAHHQAARYAEVMEQAKAKASR